MKTIVIVLIAFAASVACAPTSIQDNNVGDIVTIGVNAQLKLDNQIDQNIINVIALLLNQQGIIVRPPGGDEDTNVPPAPLQNLMTPEMVEKVKSLLK